MRRYLHFLGLEESSRNIKIAWGALAIILIASIIGWITRPFGSFYVRIISSLLSYFVMSLFVGLAVGKKRISASIAMIAAYLLPMLMNIISSIDAALFHNNTKALTSKLLSPITEMSGDKYFLGVDLTTHAIFIAFILFFLLIELSETIRKRHKGRMTHFEAPDNISDEEREAAARSMEAFFEKLCDDDFKFVQPVTEENFPYDYSKTPVSRGLKFYLDYTILPRYDKYDKGHNREHIKEVADGVLELAEGRDVDCDMLYTAAIFHDLGLCEGRETHHLASAVLLRDDSFIKEFFTAERIDIIAEAIEDHRASAKTQPRSIYGEILSSADRVIDPDKIILRSYYHSEKHYSELTSEGHIDRVYQHITEKYGDGGYLKIPILTERNSKGLERLREMLTDEAAFKSYARKYICMNH